MKIDHRPYDSLRPGPNPRTFTGLAFDDLCELAADIGRHGLNYPLRVTELGVINAGERRYRAIGLLLDWRKNLPDTMIAPTDPPVFDMRAAELAQAVPVIVLEGMNDPDLAARALADNLQRADLSTYEIACAISTLHEVDGIAQQTIADMIGKSATSVSRYCKAWRQSCTDLREAWRTGEVSFERVKELVELEVDQQRQALVRAEPRPRGSHGRPGIEAVKARLVEMRASAKPSDAYERGKLEGRLEELAWVAGDQEIGRRAS